MVKGEDSIGKCGFCGATFGKAGMTKHLMICDQRNKLFDETSKNDNCFILVVEGKYLPQYWLHLLAPVNAMLGNLDKYLRDIWLECCGHLSAFTIAGQRYSSCPERDYDEKNLNIKLGQALSPKIKFNYEYDFGTTTELSLKVVSALAGKIKNNAIQLLARNAAPSIACEVCGKAATQVCTQCIGCGRSWFCEKCGANHKCGEEMLLPVVNSPRVGMCGYTG
ncbi:hypothetical protein HZB07_06340 [Candidatus Saganbacteria bacterium]|nr:hypothetical protein [Candidatus Saganbacteria bacterium]